MSATIHTHRSLIDQCPSLQGHSFNVVTALALVLFMALVSMARGQATFQGLGDLSGGSINSRAFGVSGDGSTVVGYSGSPAGDEAFRWTNADGIQGLGDLPGGGFHSAAYGVSHDGSIIVGQGLNSSNWNEAFGWTSSGGMQGLGHLPNAHPGSETFGFARGVSGDGSTIVGYAESASATEEAFRWTQTGGMQGLGDLPGGQFESYASGVSGDGTVVVGTGSTTLGYEAFRWTAATGMQALGDISGGSFGSSAAAVSADGSTIVGVGNMDAYEFTHEAFRWTSSGGMQGLGFLPGGMASVASAVSGDGSIIVGGSYGSFPGTVQTEWRAFIWDAAHGMRTLRDVLVNDYGLDLTGWQLLRANGISSDGRTIVGDGANPAGYAEGWIAVLPEPVTPPPGDFNHDGTVDAADYIVWRKNNGTPEEYTTWRANFGATAAGAAAVVHSATRPAVPEPASVALLILAILGLFVAPRRSVAAKNRC